MNRAKRARSWAGRIREAETAPGGVSGYCRERGITKSNFYYWKEKLSKGVAAEEVKSPFAAVEIAPRGPRPSLLPDAKWLAEFLHAYAERGA